MLANPSRGERDVHDCFLVLSANHVKSGHHRSAVLKEIGNFTLPFSKLCLLGNSKSCWRNTATNKVS